MSRFPEVRALCTHALGPLTNFAIGALLILPTAAMGGLPFMESVDVVAHEVRAVDEAAGPSGVQESWREKVLERERELMTAGFAARFSISFDLAKAIHDAALKEKLDPEIAFGLVYAESRFRARAVSPVGAVGLTQVMPATASWLVPGVGRAQLMDPQTNLRIGFRYLRMLIDQYGDARLALTAYNRGPGTVDRLLRRGIDPDNGYHDFVRTGDATRHVAMLKQRRTALSAERLGS